MTEENKIVCFCWRLLNEWWCANDDLTEDEIVEAISKHTLIDATNDQIKQRLFGGFKCEESNRSHIFHDTGAYTYTQPNWDVDDDYRQRIWETLLEGNPADQIIDKGYFIQDRPKIN